MSLSTNIALRALLTSRSALDTIGQNVANANTEGYSRQTLQISNSRPLNLRGLQLGNGVQADVVTRSVDDLLNARIVGQTSSLARLDSQLVEMQSVEALIDEPGGDGFGGLLDGLFGSLSALSANTEDIVARTGVIQSTDNLIRRFRQVSGEITQLQRDAQVKAGALADDVNVLGERIVQLNEEITKVEAVQGTTANDLRDRRELALRELGKRVDITVRENVQGAVQVQIDGQLLVGARSIRKLQVESDAGGKITLRLAGGVRPVESRGGEIAGLIAFADTFANDVSDGLDRYARAIVLEMNRGHSTGVPLDGGFRQLRATNAIRDLDGDGEINDALLRDVGLPFEVKEGELFINVVEDGSDTFTTQKIDIDPERMTVQGFIDAVSGVGGLSARLDNSGRLTIDASAGTRFHFGRPLNTQPDASGTLGGGRATTVGAFSGPFAIGSVSTIDFTGPQSSFAVTIDPVDFQTVGAPTAEEIADLLNANADMASNDMRAVVVGGRLAIQTLGEGAAEAFQITGGTALSAVGLSAGSFSGQDLAVDVALSGEYRGDTNEQWTFEPIGDGTIGTTPGLEVAVRDSSGTLIATLDVGQGYAPGNQITVADGVSVSFSLGDVRGSNGEAFSAEMVADGDTSDILVALGLNALLLGDDSKTIDMRMDIREDPRLLAASATGAVGDGGAVLDMIKVQTAQVTELDGTLGEFYGTLVGGIGFEIASTSNAQEIESYLLESLEARREEVSGVNVDEELVKMIQFEQSYQAAAQFLQVVNQLNDAVMRLV